MSIDVPNWFAELFWGGDTDGNDCDAWERSGPLWLKLNDHIRAVIADEAAKAQQPAEPRADDPLMPNWFCEGYAADDGAIFLWRRVIDELTRRMSEATAERDRRIAELEKERDNYKRLFDDAIDAVDEVFQTRSDRDPPILPNFCPLGTSKFRAVVKLAKEYKSLKQQLSTVTAEVERLTEVVEVRGRDMDQMESELATLRQQLAEATRPVEDVSWDKLGAELQRHIEQVIRTTATLWLIENVKPLFQRERAARLAAEQRAAAAEAERDELRAAWVKLNVCYYNENGQAKYRPFVRLSGAPTLQQLFDDPNEAVLAAYRAEKGGVRT